MQSGKRIIFIFFLLLLVLRIQISFLGYLNFISKPVRDLNVKVINQYKKKNYFVLKLKNSDLVFYTTSRDNLKNLLNENLNIKIFTKNISFVHYLTKFYAVSYDLKLQKANFFEKDIESQHSSKEIINLFKALFLGESIDYKTRQKLSTLGIAHLFALSGLHLGFISAILFFLFAPFYTFFQSRFFPYRNRFFDLGILVLIIEFFYLFFTRFPSSLIRAYVLEAVLFVFAVNLKDIVSVKALLSAVVVAFLLFFTKIFTLGFFLSVTGVYYIYLFFRYYKPTFFNSVILSFYMFVVMFVISHYFFGNFSIYQLLAPFVTLIFTVFYPLEFFLHIAHLGGIFDFILVKYLNLGGNFRVFYVPEWVYIIFILCSILAFYKKYVFYLINGMGIITILLALGG